MFSLGHWTKHFLVFKKGRNLDYQLHLGNQTQIGRSFNALLWHLTHDPRSSTLVIHSCDNLGY